MRNAATTEETRLPSSSAGSKLASSAGSELPSPRRAAARPEPVWRGPGSEQPSPRNAAARPEPVWRGPGYEQPSPRSASAGAEPAWKQDPSFDVKEAEDEAQSFLMGLQERLHGEFTVRGVPGTKKFVFLPPHEISDPRVLSELRKFWRMKKPNLIIQTNDNTRSSHALVYQENVDDNEKLADLKRITGQEGGDNITTVNDFMHSRLLQTFGNIVVAADTTDSWILSKGHPFSNHILIQDAVKLTKASPTMVAVDNPARYIRGWNTDPRVPAEAFRRLRENARTWKLQHGDVVDIDFPQLWRGGEERDYCNWVWTGAEYFIFSVKPEEFNDQCLGPSGWVFVGGYFAATCTTLPGAIRDGLPTILLDNTGGETQEYARLTSSIRDRTNGQSQPSASELREAAPEMFVHALQGQSSRRADWTSRYGEDKSKERMTLASVLEMIDLHCSIPWLFRERVVSVNPLSDSPETILNLLSQSFASVYMKTHEIGAGPADRDAVLTAWRMHKKLVDSATVQKNRADTAALLSMLLTFFASAAAIVSTYIDFLKFIGSESWLGWSQGPLELAVFILPGLSTLVSGVTVFGGWTEKWGALFAASHRIVEAIYMFRMRVGQYSLTFGQDIEIDPQARRGSLEDNKAVRAHQSRGRFSNVIQEIMEQVTLQELRNDALFFSGEGDVSLEQLDEHVNRSVYGGRRPHAVALRRGGQARQLESRPLLGAARPDDVSHSDDNLSVMSNECYFQCRVKPLLLEISAMAPWLNKAFVLLTVMVLLCGSLATVLASLHLKFFVPIAISASVFFQSMLTYFNVKQWLQGTTVAVGKLSSLQQRWNSLGTMDRRLMGTRLLLIETCEGAVTQMVSARTGQVEMTVAGRSEASGGGGGGGGGGGDGGEVQANSSSKAV